jgi:16S rRNA (guanine1207-N2)-methyltransferase
MARRKSADLPLSQRPVPELLREKIRPPLAVILGSPAETTHLLTGCPPVQTVCYQMDLFQAQRLRAELAEVCPAARVETSADLWDLPADFQTVVYLPARRGERELKIDMVEQAFHILRPRGTFVIWSAHAADPFFPGLLKKVFGRAHVHALGADTVLWAQREGNRPRRRHEVTFQARIHGREPCRFVSRPGIFAYGRFDEGARALAETMIVHPGDRVLDLGCGCGTNGIFAAQLAGPTGFVAFVDSNLRALALAEHNARANGVAAFTTVATATVEGLAEGSFDVALANPPYFAAGAVAQLFIERARSLLKPGGRFYLVTRQPAEVAEWLVDTFGPIEAGLCRGYTVFCTPEEEKS